MIALARLIVLGLTLLFLVASCGQKGPLSLPEEGSARQHSGQALMLGAVAPCAGSLPRV